jgi:hypothetical protein
MESLFTAFIIAALCEETIKLVIAIVAKRMPSDRPYTLLLLSIGGALGMATFENFGYVYSTAFGNRKRERERERERKRERKKERKKEREVVVVVVHYSFFLIEFFFFSCCFLFVEYGFIAGAFTVVGRAILSVPMHASTGALIGADVVRRSRNRISSKISQIISLPVIRPVENSASPKNRCGVFY